MKNQFIKVALITCTFFINSICVIAQEGPKKNQNRDTIPNKPDSSVNKNQMPVVVPDDKKPPVPMPSPRVKDNEDGMPVKNLPDSSGMKPRR